jgi:hypothetical protein
MEVRPVEDKLFHADGTKNGLRKLIIAFSNYANLFFMDIYIYEEFTKMR